MKIDNQLFNFSEYLENKRVVINNALLNILGSLETDRELIRAMAHSLMAGGKRLRPILCIASAEACHGNPISTLPSACALEMIHTYSLIHDDLPAMDDDGLRRGLPTCHKKFSEATAILAGDALLTHAFFILSDPGDLFLEYPDASVRVNLTKIIAEAAGTRGMVEGQMMDMQSFSGNKENTLSYLKKIHRLKTGRMIVSSVESGAVSVGADDKAIDQLISYAKKIGLAFQVMDDILNIEGDPEILGKAVGSDKTNDKMTFPAIIGLSESKKYAKKLVEDAIKALVKFDKKADPLRALAEYIINRNH